MGCRGVLAHEVVTKGFVGLENPLVNFTLIVVPDLPAGPGKTVRIESRKGMARGL
jgi:hypothetical protein